MRLAAAFIFTLFLSAPCWAQSNSGPARVVDGNAAQESSLPTKRKTEVIAVLPLQPVGISPLHASALTDRLGEELLRTGQFTLVDRSQIDAILDEQALQQAGCTEQECAVQVGRMLGVRRMVAGKVTRIEEDLWLLSAILVDVETTQTLTAESVRHSGSYLDLLEGGIGVLAGRLAHASDSGRPPEASLPPKAVLTEAKEAESSNEPFLSASTWFYIGAGVMVVFTASEFSEALSLNDLAQSNAQTDPVASQGYEDDRDRTAKIALVSGVVALGLLTAALAASDDVPGSAFHATPSGPLLALGAQGGRIAVAMQLRW